MTETRIEGRVYELKFDLYALEQVQEEYAGGVKELFDALGKHGQVKALKAIFRIMANSARADRGDPETVTGQEINRLTVEEMVQLSKDLQKEILKSMHKETANGNEADDEVHDLYEDEEDAKNG